MVTGGSSGLGLASCADLHAHGAYVAILDMNAESGDEAVKSLGERSRFYEVDVTSSESIEKALKSVAQWISETKKPIGGIVSAAGVGNPSKVGHLLKWTGK